MLDAKRIQESQWRSRNNKTADGLQRRLNIASFKKYFDEELADRESSLWWRNPVRQFRICPVLDYLSE